MEFASVETASRFIASTLHEIRTPIQTIISTAELLGETELSDEQTEYTRQIKFSAEAIVHLANDILDFTKIRQKDFKLDSTEFNINDLVERVVDSICIEAYNKGLEMVTDIAYDIPQLIEGDPIRTQQILLNLIKNAVKFTKKGYVRISVRLKDGQLVFQVVDSGIGIPPDKRKLIFGAYYQVDASIARKFGGTGLGLAICKNLIEVMRGRIGVAENPTGGSVFWFSIPCKPCKTDSLPKSPTLRTKLLSRGLKERFLIVDDNYVSAISIKKKLDSFGIRNIDIAHNGAEALSLMKAAQAEGRPYYVSFIDMVMPKMDGWRLSFEISRDKEINGTKLYLMVPEGQMHADAKMKVLNLFNGYLYKPLKRARLAQILEDCFSDELDLSDAEPDARQEEAASVGAEPQADSAAASRPLSILIAEDHPMNRHLMEVFLKKLGAVPYSVENGQEAVDFIRAHPDIDMIFMDMVMPIKSGIDATAELRSLKYAGIIVSCTANNDPKDFANYTRLGINDFLIKPYRRESLAAMVHKWQGVITSPDGMQEVFAERINRDDRTLWDFIGFMDMNCNDKDCAKKSLELFRKQTRKILNEVRDCLGQAEPDWNTLQIDGHTLKGSSGLIASLTLAGEGAKMEQAAKSRDRKAYETAFTEFALDFMEFERKSDLWLANVK